MLPNVKVNVTEEVSTNGSGFNQFIPLVILKTKTGPIGTEVLVKTAKSFASTFGTPDSSTPEAFGLYQYIKNYGSAYVVRVAGNTAANASGTAKSGQVDLFSVSTVYKTDLYNGTDVSLVYDSTDNKLYLSTSVDGRLITSIKENLNFSTATADLVEIALNKVVDSFNEAQDFFAAENLFVDKTSEDAKPSSLSATASLTGGVNGNSSVTDALVKAAAENYRESDIGIDAILAPGFESVDVVNTLTSVAQDSSFMAIASISGSTASAILATASSYPKSSSLALYADKVRLTENTDIEVPACLGILPAYTIKDRTSRWLAPAGVTRATLSLVHSLSHSFSDNDLEELYIAEVPVNGIKKISGRGYIVWGQKTTSQETSQYQDRINVVRLIKYLTKEVYAISYDYLFEPITDYTYNSWTLRVESILEEIKYGNGLDDYKVIMDDTLNTEETKKQNKLIGVVKFKPLEAAEYIEINFVVTDTIESEGGNV